MKAHFFRLIGASVACASLLAACGGGGGGGTPAATTSPSASFALGAGYKAYITNGSKKTFNVAVTTQATTQAPATSCSGTATINSSPTTLLSAPFEGATNVSSSTQDSTLTLTNCSLTSSPTHGTTYYNADALPIALSIVNGEYYSNAGQAAPTALPGTVMVGNSNPNIDTMTIYADSSPSAAVTGKRVMGYAIAPDTSTSTAILIITTTRFDQGNNLQTTQQSSYRMAADGTLTLLSIDVQFSAFADPKQTHLVYTATN